jgi:hypothetical protein
MIWKLSQTDFETDFESLCCFTLCKHYFFERKKQKSSENGSFCLKK